MHCDQIPYPFLVSLIIMPVSLFFLLSFLYKIILYPDHSLPALLSSHCLLSFPSALLPPQSTPPLFLLGKEQASYGNQ